MRNSKLKKQLKLTEKQLKRAKQELFIFYEISNAMRTTLKLEHILYIILTSVTAKSGLDFDRAFLFLLDHKNNSLVGEMGIGPKSSKKADKAWRDIIRLEKEDLSEIIKIYKNLSSNINKGLTQEVKAINIPLDESEGIPALTALENMPHRIDISKSKSKVNNVVLKKLRLDNFISVPLQGTSKSQGVILADNLITKKPITSEDMRILTLFANQAGLAIENSRHYEKTKKSAETDSLTGLFNHGKFQGKLKKEFQRARRYKNDLSLLFIDIDFFKEYNDKFGHLEGDKILSKIGNILKDNARDLDTAARYGGEEFAIILPHTKKKEAEKIAERIRRKIEKADFKNQEKIPSKNLTVSIGISSIKKDTDSKESLLKSADDALYEAKNKGRNKVVVSR